MRMLLCASALLLLPCLAMADTAGETFFPTGTVPPGHTPGPAI
jgi:hypothetical protein